jgi:hypothetical protein
MDNNLLHEERKEGREKEAVKFASFPPFPSFPGNVSLQGSSSRISEAKNADATYTSK